MKLELREQHKKEDNSAGEINVTNNCHKFLVQIKSGEMKKNIHSLLRIRYSELIKCRKGQQDTCKQELYKKEY